MVRKRRTPLPGSGEGSESQEPPGSGSGRGGFQRSAERAPMPQEQCGGCGGRGRVPSNPQQGGRGGFQHPAERAPMPQEQGGGGGGRGRVPSNPQQPQQGGRGGGYYQARGGGRQPQPRSGIPPQRRGGPYYGPSRPPVPELHQATQAPYLPIEPSPLRASSSCQPPEMTPAKISEQFQQLSVQGEATSSQAIQPVSSSKSLPLALRPGKGSYGTRCTVKANHFYFKLPSKDSHQYDVSIMPEVTSCVVNRAVMSQLVKNCMGGRRLAYDGRKILYTPGPLPFDSHTFEVTLPDEWGGRRFTVVIKYASHVNLHHLEQSEAPQEALQALDIVLRQQPISNYTPVGRSFYSADLGRRKLSDGFEIWRGFYQSVRPTEMGLSLNIDMSCTAFIEPLPVIEFVDKLLKGHDSNEELSNSARSEIKKALKGVKVEVTHRESLCRKYRISDLTLQPTRELTFPIGDQGTMKSVVQYFQETYNFTIQRTAWPCLQVGNQQRPNYLPMEVCKIVEKQRYSKRLNDEQITAFLEMTCQRPHERELAISETVLYNACEDPYAEEFDINIGDSLVSVDARILPPPRLKYHDSGLEKDCLPWLGEWNMKNKRMVNGGRVSNWICINFVSNVPVKFVLNFCQSLSRMCQASGMDFAKDPVLPPLNANPDQVGTDLKAQYQKAMKILKPQGKELDLLIAIIDKKVASLYGDLKRICEIDLGLVSQCCLSQHAFTMDKNSRRYLSNVALKINVKVGGTNTVLVDAFNKKIPLVTDIPTIIFGADVTHPHPGDDSSPSIAAVVASQDWPEVTKYLAAVSAQAPHEELIQNGGMFRELLDSYRKANRHLPRRIIFYRDGVSEGQFNQVLTKELAAIREVCTSIDASYRPPVTFVVVQKRHHTRLFAKNHYNEQSVDKSGNILPGTVVDSTICHRTGFDFYLCSHAGIKGTSRPTHYHVLWDENNFTADELQSLTYNLCYTYARSTRSVSIVPPAYYAHLAAYRARYYLPPAANDDDAAAAAANGGGVTPLPALKEKVKKVMYYC